MIALAVSSERCGAINTLLSAAPGSTAVSDAGSQRCEGSWGCLEVFGNQRERMGNWQVTSAGSVEAVVVDA